jgi:hypothetical protein
VLLGCHSLSTDNESSEGTSNSDKDVDSRSDDVACYSSEDTADSRSDEGAGPASEDTRSDEGADPASEDTRSDSRSESGSGANTQHGELDDYHMHSPLSHASASLEDHLGMVVIPLSDFCKFT